MARHDESYRLLFSHPRMVEDLLRGFIREPWVEELDFSTLEPVSGRLVSDRLRRRETDVLWRVRWRGGSWLYVYLLIEFQSTIDRRMAVRLLGYVALLYQDLIRRKELAPGGKLPPVVPLVLYNGREPWRAARDLAGLIAPAPPGLRRYLPRLRYLLCDEGRIPRRELGRPGNLAAALFRLEQLRRREETDAGVADLRRSLAGPEQQSLREAFDAWIRKVLRRAQGGGVEAADLLETDTMLSETIKEWIQEGREEGKKEGEAELLLRQLERRFGPLAAKTRRRVAAADPEQLLLWGDRVLTAATIDEVLAD